MKSISVVTCSKDRNEFLIENFISTSKIKNLKEHIHIDFSSNYDLSKHYEVNSKLKIISFKNEPQWWLTRAFNAGFHFVTGDMVLRLNADAEINYQAFNKINLDSVNYVNFCIDNYDYGNLLCETKLIKRVNGYNEFLFGWGYDDYDLHQRLITNQDIKSQILDARKYIKIRDHDNAKRISNKSKLDTKWIEAHLLANHKKNRTISQEIVWNKNYKLKYKNNGNHYTIQHNFKINKFHFVKHLKAKSIFIATFLNEYYQRSFFNKLKILFYIYPYRQFERIYKVKILP